MCIRDRKKPVLTREWMRFWFEKFRKGDMRDMEHQRQIIDTFVNSVYVFDDRVVLNFNFTDDSKTISREEVLGSSAVENAPPQTSSDFRLRIFCLWWTCLLYTSCLKPVGLTMRVSFSSPSPQLIFHFSGSRRRYSQSPPPWLERWYTASALAHREIGKHNV